MINLSRSLLPLVLFVFSGYVLGEDLGTYRIPGAAGTSQPDRDGATVLKERMAEKYRTGEAQAIQKKQQERNVDALINPKPLAIRTDTTQRTKLYSLDYVMPVDAPGAKKGSKVNVLKAQGRLSDMAAGILLIDGRDDHQVDYAVAQSEKRAIKIVLTGGSPIKIGERYKDKNGGNGIPFFFDQKGMILASLATWYGIRIESVPAYLTNGGNGNLRVDYGM